MISDLIYFLKRLKKNEPIEVVYEGDDEDDDKSTIRRDNSDFIL